MDFLNNIDFFSNLVLSEKNLNYNLKIIKEKAKNKKICAMVKADAYGHSLKWTVLKLKNKVDFFGVSNAVEALFVRNYSIKSKILLCGKANKIKKLIENDVSLTVFSLKTLREITNICKTFHLKANVHLKLNTGMNRFGISSFSEIKKVIEFIQANSDFVNLEGIYSHLFNAKNFGLSHTQYYKFIDLLNYIKFLNVDLSHILIHLENSDGLFENVDFLNFCSMVRVGIALYGLENKNLHPVLSLFSQIVAINHIKAGDYVGYGKVVAERDGLVGVVPIGYADGIGRNYINSFVYVKNCPCKIINVCMDSILIDLSTFSSSLDKEKLKKANINSTKSNEIKINKNAKPNEIKIGENAKQNEIKIGEVVEIISTNQKRLNSVKNLALFTNQISYEIITNIKHNRLNIIYESEKN